MRMAIAILVGLVAMFVEANPAIAAPSWSPPVRIDNLPTTDYLPTPSVSCPSSSFCMAVDTLGQALKYTGGSWSAPVRVS